MSSDSTYQTIGDGLDTLLLNSYDRSSGVIVSGTYVLPRSYTNVKTLELVQFNMLNAIFAFTNAVFPLVDNSVQLWVRLTNGAYTKGVDFASQLQTDINNTPGISQTYTVTFNPITLGITISAVSAFQINWNSATGQPAGTNLANYQMGFGYLNPQDTSASTSITSPYAIHSTNTDNIGLILDVIPQNGISTSNEFYTFAIPNNVPYGSYIFYTRGVRQDQTLILDTPQSFSTVRVSLVNLGTGVPLDTNGAEFSAKFRLTLQTTSTGPTSSQNISNVLGINLKPCARHW